MFSKANKSGRDNTGMREIDAPEPAPKMEPLSRKASTTSAKGAAPRPRPPVRQGGVPSIISSDMVIRGRVESAGEVQFDGEIEGDVIARGLVIGDGAKVVGNVIAEKVRVNGTVEGSIRGVDVELAAHSLVKGDITHTSLSIESGARFEGSSRHSDDPLHDTDGKPVVRTPPAPKPAPPVTTATGSVMRDAQAALLVEPAPRAIETQATNSASGTVRDTMPVRGDAVADRVLTRRPPAADLR